VKKQWLYHGSRAEYLEDLLMEGLCKREDRSGISLTTTAKKARFWGNLATGGKDKIWLLRVPRPDDKMLQSEDDAGMLFELARPHEDFTYLADTLSPKGMQVYENGHWMDLLDYCAQVIIDEHYQALWHERWDGGQDALTTEDERTQWRARLMAEPGMDHTVIPDAIQSVHEAIEAA
jgi:hypothetical protein